MRLLSLLQCVEESLVRRAPLMVAVPVRRQANYSTGRARMICGDGSSLLLQAFPLADGQLCIKATGCHAGGAAVIEHVIYASAEGFEWRAAAEALGEVWVAALEARATAAPVGELASETECSGGLETETSTDELATAG